MTTMNPKTIQELADGRRSVCEGHAPDCVCEACHKVRSLIGVSTTTQPRPEEDKPMNDLHPRCPRCNSYDEKAGG